MARSVADRLRALQASVGQNLGEPTSVTGSSNGDSSSDGHGTSIGDSSSVGHGASNGDSSAVGHDTSNAGSSSVGRGTSNAGSSSVGSSGHAEPQSFIEERTPAGHEALRDGGFVWDEHFRIWHRTVRADILTLHGSARYGDIFSCDLQSLARLAKVSPLSPEKMRFYDTETTGLGTGAGTIPFLHAVGQFEDDEFVVHQYFLSDYSGEAGLIERMMTSHFSHPDTVIVSFNGKSFDWPLLKTRMTMYRLQTPSLDHVDLLYPSRRFWREKLPRVSLAQVEESVLGLTRTDDVPGKEAPTRYFEFVADGEANRLMPIFEHNATDVCSLVTLAVHLSRTLNQKGSLDTASEWAALGRIYDEWRESELAAHCFKAATDCPDATWKEHWLRSLNAKRRGDWLAAIGIWEWMADKYEWSVQPCVELAKAYEHRLGGVREVESKLETTLDKALGWAKEANSRVKRWASERVGASPPDVLVQALDHRIARIERKLAARH